ncbi:MAG TPA: penicillin-insensitive murein endopeptidase [Polyangiaceae bacterium]|nr:penicillin-insensitive murein endopeptidase [Polyangiaceae bacterium]
MRLPVHPLPLALALTLAFTGCARPGTRPGAAAAPSAPRPAPSLAAASPAAGSAPASAPADAPPASPQGEETADDDDDEGPDDEGDVELPPDATLRPPHPLANVSDRELEERIGRDLPSLGSMSVGRPNGGLLVNGVQLSDGDAWTVVAPGEAWATEETSEYLKTAIHAVTARFPDSPKLAIGDVSARGGGYLKPHLSHQSGRDVDISYYYRGGGRWYQRATAENLDLARTWAFVRALVTLTDVDLLLIDHSIQALLRDYAESIGEDRDWLGLLFKGRGAVPPIIRHAPGHATHLHIRFYNPIAQETGRRAYPVLVRRGLVKVGPQYFVVTARKGDTLARLAKRYDTTVRAIRRANNLRSTLIQAKRTYRIPVSGRAPPALVSGPVAIPPRRLPPGPAQTAAPTAVR